MNKLQAIRTRSQEGDKFIIVRSGQQPVSYVDVSRDEVDLLLAVAEAAADIVRVMTPIEHPKSPTDYAYGKVTNEQWRALVATIAPLLEEAE